MKEYGKIALVALVVIIILKNTGMEDKLKFVKK